MKKYNIISIIIILLCSILFVPLSTYADNTKYLSPKLEITSDGIHIKDKNTAFDKAYDEVGTINYILEEYRLYIVWGSAVVALTMIGLFIVNLIRLGNSRGNPQARASAISGLIFTGIATALAGSVTTFTQMFYGFLK